MEQIYKQKISDLGYNHLVCSIFEEWENVKDEILVSDRKKGSGNGTIHIFLGAADFELRKEFSAYYSAVENGENPDISAITINHYFIKSNIVSMLGYVCQYCFANNKDINGNVISILNSLSKEPDLITTTSLFKLSLGSNKLRPYFKQFDQDGPFTNIIRKILIPGSSYKISLYKNDKNEYAAFWLLGFENLSNFEADSSSLHIKDKKKDQLYQHIYYGTPGSGKSHKVKELVKESYIDEQELEEFVFRTTFHPDSDYASFVGCYKPVMKCVVNVDIDDKIYNKEQLITKILEFNATGTSYVYHRFGAKYWRSLNKLSAQDLKDIIKKNDPNANADNQYTELSKGMKVGEYLSNENVKEEISYEFIPQVFTKAYVKAWQNPGEPVYLIIEEINRGNCAQIFGDLFQLLDRKDGVSEYPIDADNDLKDYLEKELGVGHDGIANGKLRLPSNLNILATMNTSDQSLFPMDSAFKRRWSWQCVPIEYEEKKRDGSENNSYYFTINIDNDLYSWHDFLKKVNVKIKKTTLSEDKQMGNFFITNSIDERQFIDKVMFYLWNDICKDEYGANSFFRRYIDENNPESEFSFNDLFEENYKDILTGFMKYLSVEIIKTENNSEQ